MPVMGIKLELLKDSPNNELEYIHEEAKKAMLKGAEISESQIGYEGFINKNGNIEVYLTCYFEKCRMEGNKLIPILFN
jgi:hypothetical protein